MNNNFSKILKYYISVLLIFISSCAKEIYTDEDAANAKREAQKTGLTVMIRDVGNPSADLSGFTVATSQCGENIEGLTSDDGIANLKVIQGDAVLHVRKTGYITAIAVVTTRTGEKERSNTVVIIPVISDTQGYGTLSGTVSVKTLPPAEEPLVGALVSINLDMNELMRLAFQGLSGNMDRYIPRMLTYSSVNLMQPVRTNISGEFQLAIPATAADLAYTVSVHETAWTRHTFCSANQTVVTNGKNSPMMFFHLTPYEK